MSHIKNIEIKNFKSIRHAKIEDCRRVNVFIGYPNVGKSNILEVMSLMSYLNDNYRRTSYKDLCRFKELIDLFNDGDKKKNASISADGFSFTLDYLSKNEISFLINDNDLKSRDVQVISPETAAGLIQPIFKKGTIDKNGNIGLAQTRGGNQYDVPNVKKYHFGAQNFEAQLNPNGLDAPFGRNLAEVIRHNSDLRKECGEIFSNYNLKLVFDENENIIVQKQLDEFSAFQFSFSQVADTLQRLIFHKAAILTNERAILLFEEPEAHMFPPYIGKFTSDVIYDKNENQFFLTTHSPFVLNDLMEDMDPKDLSIYAVGYLKGETTINRLTDKQVNDIYQYGVDLFFNLEDFLKDVVI